MTVEGRLPVVIGVGQLRSNKERDLEKAREPLDLIVEAAGLAAEDSGIGPALLTGVDRVDVVRVVSWAYDDLPGLVSAAVGAAPRVARHAEVGGNTPCLLVDRAAAAIADGSHDVVLVCGAESAASTALAAKVQAALPWSRTPGGPVRFAREIGGTEYAYRHKLVQPIRAYPLYENALRAALGQSFAEMQARSGELYAAFSEVAARRPSAWNPEVLTAADIATVTPANRMVCHPYPLRMNAMGAVDQAAAVVVTSLETAQRLGVPADRIVHVWGGAGSADSRDILQRSTYSASPAMEACFDTALEQAGLQPGDLSVVDLYSCFPVVPKLAALHLGLPASTPLTATGGLTSFGGPGNNYSLHAIANVVDELRAGQPVGAVYGNGEFVTKHHVLLLGAEPHPRGYVGSREPVAAVAPPPPPLTEVVNGPATVETWTVEYAREGSPRRGWVIGRLGDGSRFLSNVEDADTLAALTDPAREPVGSTGVVDAGSDGRNLFHV